ncbi:unnamed protein product [Nippostrongylus brasiliensis]|uniref:Uncharacterized protein n=1 Tax=Nippostrongylus brasiliensis TaxID=27835 RepID=A0A0N4XHZ3_NIPBR|nr:unnamed protein product [Nippostrongylus brasiliensis]
MEMFQSDTDLVLRGGTANANELRTPLIYSDPELPAQSAAPPAGHKKLALQKYDMLSISIRFSPSSLQIPELGDGGLSEQSMHDDGTNDDAHPTAS